MAGEVFPFPLALAAPQSPSPYPYEFHEVAAVLGVARLLLSLANNRSSESGPVPTRTSAARQARYSRSISYPACPIESRLR